MRHSLRHRMLCVLAALSLAFSAAPASVAPASAATASVGETSAEGHLPACSVSGVSPADETAGPGAAPAAAVTGGELDRDGGPPCGHRPCSMPLAACTGAGACLSMVPLPASASPALSRGLLFVPALGPERGPLSPASGILTPPPRS